MKIKLVSDLHLEFSDCFINNNEGADVLILGGDIMVAQDLHDHAAADFNPYSNGALAEKLLENPSVRKAYERFLLVAQLTKDHTVGT